MISIRILCGFFFLSVSQIVNAQSGSVVKKAYAFYTVQLPGNIAVNANGVEEPVKTDTAFFIYLETASTLIKWDTAWMNERCFLMTTQNITKQKTVSAGTVKNTGKKVIITAAKNNVIWQLYLQPLDLQKRAPKKTVRNKILLKGKYRGKDIYQKVDQPEQLETMPSV